MFVKFPKTESAFVLLDQAVVSGGNFATTLVLARTLQPALYGKFSLLLLFLYAINTCHSSLIVYPLTLQVAKADENDLPRVTSSSLLQTSILSAMLAVVCLLFVFATGQVALFLPLFGAMLCWQLQETTRRALLASQNAAKAVLPDLLCYVGQGALIFLLKPTSMVAILAIIAGTSILALLWQMLAIKMQPQHLAVGERMQADVRFAWKMGQHILGGNAFNMLALQVPSWSLAWMVGPLGVAGYQSLLNLAGLANPIIFSVNTSLIPAVARTAPQGYRAARKTALRLGMQFGALLIPCFLTLAFFPRFAMRTVYGVSSPYLYLASMLPIFIGAYAVQYLATVVGAYEGGMSRPETYFKVQSSSTVVLALFALAAIHFYGIKGAIFAIVAFSIFRLFAFTVLSIRADKREARLSLQPVAPPSSAPEDVKVQRTALKVSVCLLTYRRTELLQATLSSLKVQTALRDPNLQVSVLVVDNDAERSAEVYVPSSLNGEAVVHYLSNPRNGLSTGRNLALEHSSEADYVVFIDDDETASPTWLAELLRSAEQNAADVVTGPVFPDFVNAPDWVERGNFFGPVLRKSGERVDHVATNNTLVASQVVAKFRFDVRFDSTGGEDTDFFLRVRDAGHKMIWCNEAAVKETIPDHRANAPWIISRAKSDANRFTHGYLNLRPGLRHRFVRLAKSAAGFAMGIIRLPLSILGKHHYVRARGYFARSSGTIAALRGRSRADYSGQGTSVKALPVVVVGQTPPPLNGQTIMIRDFVAGTYDDISITYVPMRFSRETKEVGVFDVRKILVAFTTVFAILRGRYASGAQTLYYPPAGANLVPVLRDFILLILCRPFFRSTVFHFHAAGLSNIYARLPLPLRPFFRLAYQKPDLAIFTTEATSGEAAFLHARSVAIVPCGVPDPEDAPLCLRSATLPDSPPVVLFAGILCEGKGVLTLLQACAILKNRGIPFSLRLMGGFQSAAFEGEVTGIIREFRLENAVSFCGLLSGREKEKAFRDADVFCFPSHYPAESFGVVLIEAMSFSLPIVATDWQGIPEVTSRDGCGTTLVEVRRPEALALAIEVLLKSSELRQRMGAYNRQRYLERFTLVRYREGLASALSAHVRG